MSLKLLNLGRQHPQDVRKKGSKILKLPRFAIVLYLQWQIIKSLKLPKIKKILLYEMKFFVPIYSCLQNSWLGGYRLQILILSVLNWICWTPRQTKFLGTPLCLNDTKSHLTCTSLDNNDRFQKFCKIRQSLLLYPTCSSWYLQQTTQCNYHC